MTQNTQPNTTLNNLKNIYNKVNIVQANKMNSKPTETSWIHFLKHGQQREQLARLFSTWTTRNNPK